jgi:hypothetical protein
MKTLSLIFLGTMMIALLGGTQDSKRVGEAYPLTICPVSKRPLGETPVVVVLEDMPDSSMNGREIKFCCGGCTGRFMADKVENTKKLDEVIIKDQLKVYPVSNCIVMRRWRTRTSSSATGSIDSAARAAFASSRRTPRSTTPHSTSS